MTSGSNSSRRGLKDHKETQEDIVTGFRHIVTILSAIVTRRIVTRYGNIVVSCIVVTKINVITNVSNITSIVNYIRVLYLLLFISFV